MHIAVAGPGHALHGRAAGTADQDVGATGLGGDRARGALLPDLSDLGELVAEHLPAPAWVHTAQLVVVVAGADGEPESEAPTAEHVEGGRLLRQQRR